MYLIILPIIALFLGADDKVSDMENRIAEYQAEIDEITPELNEMNRMIEIKQKTHDKWKNDYRIYSNQLDEMKKDDPEYSTIQYLRDVARSEWLPLRDELRPMISVRDALQEKLDFLIIEQELVQKNMDALIKTIKPTEPKLYISLSLSQTCQTLIGGNMTTDCPTYKTLIGTFDNTVPGVSGDFIEKDNDLKRDHNQMVKHWQYYPQNGFSTVVMVDPDIEYKKQAVNIEVQSNDFRVSSIWGEQSKQHSFVNNTITSYNGFSVDNDCTQINTAPDLEMITMAIGFAISGCTEELDLTPNVTQLNATQFDKYDSKEYKYQGWLNQVIRELELDATVDEKIEELDYLEYPKWFNTVVEWVSDDKITNQEFINAFKVLKKEGIIA